MKTGTFRAGFYVSPDPGRTKACTCSVAEFFLKFAWF
jgi:hypothetical protein